MIIYSVQFKDSAIEDSASIGDSIVEQYHDYDAASILWLKSQEYWYIETLKSEHYLLSPLPLCDIIKKLCKGSPVRHGWRALTYMFQEPP